MTIERHLVDLIYAGFYRKESVYGEGVTPFNAASACQLTDYDDASPHPLWDDVLQANTDVLTGSEFPTHQEIPRQSMSLTYTEPRTKPNTLAGLLGLTMGSVPAPTRDGGKNAWRHRFLIGGATTLPSIALQVNHDLTQVGTGFRYHGVKCSTLTLSNNGAYWQVAATLMGSGYRASGGGSGPGTGSLVRPDIPIVRENWLRWGDTRFFMRPLTSGVLTIPNAPTQRASNLSGGQGLPTIEMSPFMRSFSVTFNNNLATDAGYRPWSGLLRSSLHATRREITMEMTFDVDNRFEVAYIDNYLKQRNISLEVDCGGNVPIATGGTYRYGFQLLFPALRLSRLAWGEQDTLETMTYSATVLDDRTNSPMAAWVYNAKNRYLQ